MGPTVAVFGIVLGSYLVFGIQAETRKSNKVINSDDDVMIRLRRATGGLSQTEINTQLNKHNTLRTQEQGANLKFMKWNSVLAEMAQTWAEACDFVHGQPSWPGGTQLYSNLGQNLYFTTGGYDHNAAVQAWYDEKSDYNYDGPSCSGVCGHYTQVVWASSYELGCGKHLCSTLKDSSNGKSWNNAHYLVCNYGPPGNYVGAKPYVKGDPCSKCDSGEFWCYSGLCRDCPADGVSCPCASKCQNCGTTVSTTCSCTCMAGWTGVDCSAACEDKDALCGVNPGYPAGACGNQIVKDKCPAQCAVCQVATAATPTCAPSSQGSFMVSVIKNRATMLILAVTVRYIQ